VCPFPAAFRRDLNPIEIPKPQAAKGQEVAMMDTLVRYAFNDKVTRAAHWTVFSVGVLSLTFSIAATAASAF